MWKKKVFVRVYSVSCLAYHESLINGSYFYDIIIHLFSIFRGTLWKCWGNKIWIPGESVTHFYIGCGKLCSKDTCWKCMVVTKKLLNFFIPVDSFCFVFFKCLFKIMLIFMVLGWLGRLSVLLLISDQILISGLWVQALHSTAWWARSLL